MDSRFPSRSFGSASDGLISDLSGSCASESIGRRFDRLDAPTSEPGQPDRIPNPKRRATNGTVAFIFRSLRARLRAFNV